MSIDVERHRDETLLTDQDSGFDDLKMGGIEGRAREMTRFCSKLGGSRNTGATMHEASLHEDLACDRR